MSDPIYFQWQNEYLLRTIYPLRDMKLRDFLIFFYEIDIWQQYKGKQIQSIAGEVQAYRAAQKAKIIDAYNKYQQLEAYLLDEDVTDQYQKSFPNLDASIMAQINDVHKNFNRYFPKYNSAVKEKYFASDRLRQMEELAKKTKFQISEKQRILRNMGPTWGKKAQYEADQKLLETVSIKMVEQELSHLVAFVGAYEQLDRYRQDTRKQKAAREKELLEGDKKLQVIRAELEALQGKLRTVQAALTRMKNPPNIETLKAHFLDDDVTDLYRQKYGEVDSAVMNGVNEVHRAFKAFFPHYKNVEKEKSFIAQRKADLERAKTFRQQELATATRFANTVKMELLKKSLGMLEDELAKINDLQWLYEIQGKPANLIAAQIAQAEKDLLDTQNKIRTNQSSLTAQDTILGQIKAVIGTSDKDMMLAAVDAMPVTVNDIVRSKVEDFRNNLMAKTPAQLLEAVVQEFMRNPTRYPLWLQYMVIHFSGMRYQSAHGSWADPKDMLLSLRMRAIEQRLKKIGPSAVNALSEERFLCYQSAGAAPILDGGEQTKVPSLTQATEAMWKRRIEHHVKALDPSKGYNKYRALLDVQIDEEDYEIQKLSDKDALAQLEDMKDELPEWMWNEIVRTTNLRLTQVKNEKWEQASAEESEARYAAGMAPFREILDKWKRENLTGWREEHDRANQLIVTRAVCNEIAEHCQHIRGRTPSGGLTAKPEWYMRFEKDPRLGHVPDKPYFRKAMAGTDFRMGASIFWLRWVNKEPNAWQITRPIVLRTGEELIPLLKDANNEMINTGNSFIRKTRFQEKDPSGKIIERQSQQWLRWMHEATVVEVTETADGPTVLTFETALPGEDRRQSTIGVFKRYVSDLKYNVSASVMNATFVGYIPEGAVPYDDLRDMLNWNRVLQREAYTPAQIEQYWQKVTKPVDPSIAFAAEFMFPETRVEVVPMLRQQNHSERIVCYEVDIETNELCLYQPPVELHRGTRMQVIKDQAQQFGEDTYFPVARCDTEPRSESLFIRADQVMDAPAEKADRLVKARKDISLYRLCYANEKLQPVFEASEVNMEVGTKFVISTVHKISPADRGDGSIHGQGRHQYHLIVSCPELPAAEGLFVRKSEQRKMNPKQA